MSKINKKLIFTILFWITLAGGFFVKSFYVQYSIKLTDVPYNDDALIIKFILISALVMTLMIPVIFGRFKYVGGIFMAALVGLLLFADTLYGRYYGLPLSMPILYQVGFVDDISSSTSSLLKWKDIVFFLDLPVLMACMYMLRKEWKSKIKIYYRAGALGLAMVSVFIFNGMAKDVNTIHHAYERKNIAKDFGVYYYHGYDIVDTGRTMFEKMKGVSDKDLKRVVEYFDNKPTLESLEHNYEGYNLLVIQIEAMQEFVVDLEVEGRQVTPFMNQLKQDHLYFGNLYHQVAGGNTSDAEFMLNNSLYPAPVGAVNYLYSQNTYDSIATILNEEGYDTRAYHGYQSSFWNRTIMYNTVGYDDYHGQESFNLDEKVGWAISDESFYRQVIQDMSENQPFHKFLITLSSHHPYDAFRKDIWDVGEFESTQVGDYIKSMAYVDMTIRRMFNNLEEAGLKDNTLVVIYGDHSGLYLDQKQGLNKLLGLPDNNVAWQSIQKVPLWIITPDGYYQEVSEKVGGQVDILPTIGHLMNFDTPRAIGQSLLSDQEGYAVKRDGSMFFDNYYYNKGDTTLYDLTTLKPLSISDGVQDRIDSYYESMIVSDLILKYDVFSRKAFDEAVSHDED